MDIGDISGLQTALNSKENKFNKNTAFNKNFGTSAGTVAQGNHTHAASALTGVAYKIWDGWLRENGDNSHFKIYGNSRTLVMRTDGISQYSNNGSYPFIWLYGGDDSSKRKMILHSDGKIWTSAWGWLDQKFSDVSHSHSWGQITGKPSTFTPTSHNHDDRYYTETESDSRFLGKTAKATDANLLDGKDSSAFVQYGTGTYSLLLGKNGSTSDWLRTTSQGLLPYQAGGSGSIGTSSWNFNTIYGKTIYENNTALSNKYLGKTAKATDSYKLDGFEPASAPLADYIVRRDSAADVRARLFRSTYQTQGSISSAATVTMRVNTSSDNYLRHVTKAGFLSWLGSTNDSRPYKVITGLVSQSGSGSPIVVILENTSGSTINSRGVLSSGDGGCTVGFTGTLFSNRDKVYYNLNDNIDYNANRILKMDIRSDSQVIFRGFENGTGKRGLFDKVPFEIRIYD